MRGNFEIKLEGNWRDKGDHWEIKMKKKTIFIQ